MRSDFVRHLVRRSRLPIQLLIVLLLMLQSIGPASAQSDSGSKTVSPIKPNAPMDTPIPVLRETYNEWTMNSGLLYWAERCYGGEFLGPSTLKRMAASGSVQRLLFTTDSANCLTYLDMVADSDGLYYYDAYTLDNRIETRSSGTPATATTVYTLTAGLVPVGERLAVSGNYVYWLTTDNRLVRASKDGTLFDVVVSTISTGTDLVVVGGSVYWLDSTGLWQTDVNCGSLPCAKSQLSTVAGQHLTYYYQGYPFALAGPRWVWVAGQSLRKKACSSISILCSESTIYTVPNDGNPWTLGRPATDGTNLYWAEGYSNIGGLNTGRLRRMSVNGGSVVDIATNLYYYPGPVYLDSYYVYFPSTDIGMTDILKLPLNASALTRDLAADALEVTQGIQNLANDTPLVADKTTYVRAYATEITGTAALDTDAYLYGTRNGNPLPGSPLHPINGRRWIATSVNYDRAWLNSGWLFQLPASWIQSGNISLRVVVDPLQSYTDPNRANNELTKAITFSPRSAVCNIFIPVRTNVPLPSTNIANFWQMIDYATRLWPTASFRSYHQDEPLEELEFCSWHDIPYPCFGPYELPDDTWKVFTALGVRDALTDDPGDCDVHYVGMVAPGTDTGTTTGTGMTSVFNFAWVKFSNDQAASTDPFAPVSGETLAHEIAHNLGRDHVNCGNPDGVDNGYPYPTNQLDNIGAANHYGFDVKSLTPIAPNGAKDFMSYCTPKWTSDYTWKALYSQLSPFILSGPAAPIRTQAATASNILLSGAVTSTANTGELGYAWNFPVSALSANTLSKWQKMSANKIDATSTVTYHVRLLGASNTILSDNPVTPVAPDIHTGPSLVQVFMATITIPITSVSTIELLQFNTVLASLQPGSSVPTVSVLKPIGGAVITDHLDISWQGHDADSGDIVHYAIQYSPDSGATWRSIANDVVGTPDSSPITLTLNHVSLPGSSAGGARIRVAASDGYHTGLAVSAPFTLTNRSPEPFIITPGQGETTPADQAAVVRGAASDAEDGDITGAGLTWQVDGQAVGTGEDLNVAGLAPGAHALVLTARDSVSKTATTSTTLTVLPLGIPIGSTPALDGLCDDAGYAAGSQILLKPYSTYSNTQASVRLLRDSSSVWACFSGLITGTVAPGAFVGLRIDVDHSRDNFAQATDYGFFVGEDGGVLTTAGNGVGGFANPGPGGLLAQINSAGATWSAELRIDAAKLGGLDHLIGLTAGHYSVTALNDDYVWPYTGVSNQPKTWATTALAALPQINHLSPGSATVGDLGFTLVISGQNFLNTSQALWNGVPLSTTFGDSSVISATINASKLNTAGMITLTVRNTGTIDSGPSPFTLRNPQPAITTLAPNTKLAEGPAFILIVNGTHFVNGAKVFWNGDELPTTFVNSGQLIVSVDANRIYEGRTVDVTVLNPDPEAQVSPAAVFTVLPKYYVFLPLITK